MFGEYKPIDVRTFFLYHECISREERSTQLKNLGVLVNGEVFEFKGVKFHIIVDEKNRRNILNFTGTDTWSDVIDFDLKISNFFLNPKKMFSSQTVDNSGVPGNLISQLVKTDKVSVPYLTESQFVAHSYKQEVWVHQGFLDAYMGARTDIHREYLKVVNQNPDFTSVITGHSLGAAIATHSMIDFAVNDLLSSKAHVVLNGCPAPGNKEFALLAKQSAASICSFATRVDPVFWILRYKYSPVGDVHFLNPELRFPFFLKNHLHETYLSAIERLLK